MTKPSVFESYEEPVGNPPMEAIASTRVPRTPGARLTTFYVSRDRVLGLLGTNNLPPNILAVLQGADVAMASAILSNALGTYLLDAIASGGVKTLQQLVHDGELVPGAMFIYNGHFFGKGFGKRNNTTALSLTEKLDDPLEGMTLSLAFSKNGLTNDTAYVRMSGSTRLFAFGYIAEVDATSIHAIPYAIGDLVDQGSSMPMPFLNTLELRPAAIQQFAGVDETWQLTKAEFAQLANYSERVVKELICELLGEHEVPSDWGGEESDVFSANLIVGGTRKTGAFLLKGPAKFHPMTMKDCGKNADQIHRLFNISADIYIVQHCHNIGAAVRKTVEAFAMQRSFRAPCSYIIMDGTDTAQLLRAHGRWTFETH